MRAFLTCFLALGLAAVPALAGTSDKDATKEAPAANTAEKAAPATKPAEPAKPAAAAKPAAPPVEEQLQQLRNLIQAQTQELEAQRAALRQQQQKMDELAAQLKNSGTNHEIVSTAPGANASGEPLAGTAATGAAVGTATVSTPAPANPQEVQPGEKSPLQFRIGSAYITPVGFVDFTGVWRSKDGGSGIGTNFAGIPYGNVFSNNLSEFRFSMQNSRIGFRVDADVHGSHVIGYMESDFLGNNPGNVAVSSNSNTLRSRLYWVDLRKDQWEVLGGQTWSLITPGRSGISPLPADIFYTQNMDVNYQLGLVWGRIPELRVVYHPTDKMAFAVALDSPEQYIGGSSGGSLITLPAAFGAFAGTQLNNGASTLGVPNRGPDIIAKVAFDPTKRIHIEGGGVERQFQLFNTVNGKHFSKVGGGGFINLNIEVVKGLRLVTNNFWSDGGGRYIFGQAPDLVVRANGDISLVHSGSTVTGFEYTHGKTMLFGYYGGLYVSRDIAIDTNGKPVGYGFNGAPSGQNRVVHEGTFGFNQTFWKDAKYGALNFIGQYSYLTRDPWFVATGQPKNALLNMVFVDLRYTLPGSAPTIGK